MKIFLDTANIKQIRQATELGIIDGVTTNPTLMARTGQSINEVIVEICELVQGPVSVETVAETAEEMVKDAYRFRELSEHVVVKFPFTEEGVKATSKVSRDGVKTNVTLIFTPVQALLAAKAGATYVSPFMGRLDDLASPGIDLVRQIVTIFDQYDYATQVLAASVRHPVHVLEIALSGADVATIPYPVFTKLFHHPLTTAGIQRFNEDHKHIPGERENDQLRTE